MLAELGYIAFCADMYGQGKTTEDPQKAGNWSGHLRGDVEQWRQRAIAGLEVLKNQPQTDTDNLAAIG
jgi:dienelactone hydrolase